MVSREIHEGSKYLTWEGWRQKKPCGWDQVRLACGSPFLSGTNSSFSAELQRLEEDELSGTEDTELLGIEIYEVPNMDRVELPDTEIDGLMERNGLSWIEALVEEAERIRR
ncbi:hypothetical protein HO173_005548 [Letharia columbiana]|uniref:Uncharacterized protein n=1 Tax=Letharia columbiana TaxID=112416 RepID=A0A8H6FWV2_9LECA|nr:uncharacterized protein HO173_005548 [Letharia columbiana]KAF6236295.1 hypothetical protein HO173_005548 [Letharia columbiana]